MHIMHTAHTHTCAHKGTCAHTYRCACPHTCAEDIHAGAHTCTQYTCHTHMCARTGTCAHTYMCACPHVHRRAGTHTHVHTDLTDAPPPSSKPPLTGCGITLFRLYSDPLPSHTPTRGAVILRWDSGFGQEACVQRDGRGLPRPCDMPVIPPSPRASRGECPLLQVLGHVLPAAPGGQHPRPPCSHLEQRL